MLSQDVLNLQAQVQTQMQQSQSSAQAPLQSPPLGAEPGAQASAVAGQGTNAKGSGKQLLMNTNNVLFSLTNLMKVLQACPDAPAG